MKKLFILFILVFFGTSWLFAQEEIDFETECLKGKGWNSWQSFNYCLRWKEVYFFEYSTELKWNKYTQLNTADFATFEVLDKYAESSYYSSMGLEFGKFYYSKDKNNVYFKDKVISWANPSKFHTWSMLDNDYSYIENTLYFEDKKVGDGFDVSQIEFITDHYSIYDENTLIVKDKTYSLEWWYILQQNDLYLSTQEHVFYAWELLEDIDPATFWPVDNWTLYKKEDKVFQEFLEYSKDFSDLYDTGYYVEATRWWYTKDRNYVVYDGKIIKDADPDTFEILWRWYWAKDKNYVYAAWERVPWVSSQDFTLSVFEKRFFSISQGSHLYCPYRGYALSTQRGNRWVNLGLEDGCDSIKTPIKRSSEAEFWITPESIYRSKTSFIPNTKENLSLEVLKASISGDFNRWDLLPDEFAKKYSVVKWNDELWYFSWYSFTYLSFLHNNLYDIIEHKKLLSEYRIQDPITRWEFAKIVYRYIENIDPDNIHKLKCFWQFSDMNESDWSCKYAEALLKKWIISPNKNFNPERNVSKAEAIKMIMNARWENKQYNTASWQNDYIQTAVDNFLLSEAFTDYDAFSTRWWIFGLIR